MNYKDTVMYKEIGEQPEALRNAARVNAGTLKKLAAAIGKFDPTGVYLAARGTSDHAGVYFKYLAETVWGIPVAFAAPSVVSLYGGKLDLKYQLVIGVSQSGKAADVLEIIKRGKQNGALTVSVTNDEGSPLAKAADYHLFCAAGEEKSVAATKTFTTEALLLALLVAAVTGDKTLEKELKAAPDLAAEALKAEPDVERAALRFVNDKDCYVLGRGIVYGAVLEASLKLQETCYLRAKSYASSDFVHGPFAVMDKGTKAILLAPSDESLAGSLEMSEKLKSVEADITAITDSQKITGDCTLRLPDSGRYAFLFAAAPVLQLSACVLSCAKGIGPDAPRGLKKVTITK
ncbi:glucosamine--fructose-6-phosphate aminotransferase [Clostridia bacterium]|nr:glucosamine--fructose-6-phosphate aminotransferase [Clostridia bacterium]